MWQELESILWWMPGATNRVHSHWLSLSKRDRGRPELASANQVRGRRRTTNHHSLAVVTVNSSYIILRIACPALENEISSKTNTMARDVSEYKMPISLLALLRGERPYSYTELATLKIPVLPDDTKLTLDQVKCILVDVIINNHADVFRAASVLTVPLFGDEFSKVEPFEYVVTEPPELQKAGTRLMEGLECNECIALNDLYFEWGDERVQAQIIANTALLAALTSPYAVTAPSLKFPSWTPQNWPMSRIVKCKPFEPVDGELLKLMWKKINRDYVSWKLGEVVSRVIAQRCVCYFQRRDLHPHDAVRDEAFCCMNMGVFFAQFSAYSTLMDFLNSKGKTLSDLHELLPAPFIADFKAAVERRRIDLEASPCWYPYCHALKIGFVREFSFRNCPDIAYFGIALKALWRDVNATVGDVPGVYLSEEVKRQLCEYAKIVVRGWQAAAPVRAERQSSVQGSMSPWRRCV
ncbi:unnamed protein product [Mesocestoides corti]|uniref:Ligand-binding domain of nuclear hormone receptor n=1 Tax=Mesocestoides corti TaxID=53468 RepID=A0A0R3UPW4_MESCO|nr:unnamed protein product [Mesocestoides corti]